LTGLGTDLSDPLVPKVGHGCNALSGNLVCVGWVGDRVKPRPDPGAGHPSNERWPARDDRSSSSRPSGVWSVGPRRTYTTTCIALRPAVGPAAASAVVHTHPAALFARR